MLLLRAHGARLVGLGVFLAASWASLGALLGALEALSGRSWQVFGPCWDSSWGQNVHFMLENIVFR